jgi:hypothetical protein
MSEEQQTPPAGESPKSGDLGSFSQVFSHNPVAARVPERLARGVLSTGVLVLDGPNEFVLDFLQGLARPYQIVGRVVLAPTVMSQLIQATQDNVNRYVQAFGPPPVMPKGPQQRPTIAEIYENFKLPEEMLSGVYSNSILIGHTPSEFFFDFITGFYPTAAVSARIHMSAPQIPRMLETLKMAREQFNKRYPHPPAEPPG